MQQLTTNTLQNELITLTENILNVPKILITDPIDKAGLEILSNIGQVEVQTKLSPEELREVIPDYEALMIRSGTRVTQEIIEAATNLKIIGRAGVGVDNIDVAACTRRGIIVVNSPAGNTIAAAEHTVAMMLSLSRHVPEANQSVKNGKWERKQFTGVEIYQKTLGIVGLGKIGSHVATIARSMGMNLIAYDPFISPARAEKMGCTLVDLETLFKEADYITLHIPKTPETRHLINAETLAMMKPTTRIINCSRGGIIDEVALAEALKNGTIAGAALDVFETEPLNDSPLLSLGKNVILTPHLGASTKEAQINVAVDVAEQIRDVFLDLPPRSAINIPSFHPAKVQQFKPYLQLAETLGNLAYHLAKQPIESLEVTLRGEVAVDDAKPLTVAALKGFLSPTLKEQVNYVNAQVIAQEQDIDIVEICDPSAIDYAGTIEVSIQGASGDHSIKGALIEGKEIRVTEIDEFFVNFVPNGYMLMVTCRDIPGIIGKIGVLLGQFDVNIASMQVGRHVFQGDALLVLCIDSQLSPEILQEIADIPGIRESYTVNL